MTLGSHPVFVVMAVAVAAPLLAELRIGVRIPVVVLEVVLGILVGPYMFHAVEIDAFLSTMMTVGTAAVLFMAGMEIDFERIRGRPLTLALAGWAASLGLGLLVVVLLHVIPGVNTPLMVVLALIATGLGTLLPILRDGGLLETQFARLLLAAGTVGELGPIVAVSLALSNRYSSWQEFGFLIVLLAVIGFAAAIAIGARPPRVLALFSRTMRASTQLPIRVALLILCALVVLSIEFGFEGIFGAFAAGMVIGVATRGPDGEPFRAKIDAVCFGWFAPFFFIGTGMQFDLAALAHDGTTMLLVPTFLMLLLLVRGAPVFLLYRRELAVGERLPFAFFSSVTSLGLVVVITEVGLRTNDMNPDIAQALVGAALLSLLVYPTLAGMLLSRVSSIASRANPG